MTSTSEPTARVRCRQDRNLALLGLSLGFGVVQLDVSVVNVALHAIGADLGAGVSSLQWVVDAYTVALASLILGAGALGDRIGARRVYLAGLGVFTVASAACGLAPDQAALITSRAVQGVGASVLIPCSLTLLNHAYPEPDDRQRAVGLWLAGASITLSGGPVVGGVLTSALGWRWIFFINVPLGVLAVALTWRHSPETPRSGRRGDPLGQVLATLALVAVAYAVVGAGRSGVDSPVVVGAAAVAVAAALAFVVAERRVASPLLPLRLFRTATFSATTVVGLLLNVTIYGLLFVLSLWWQQVHGYSALRAGLAFLPMTMAILVANLGARRVVAAQGVRRTMVGGATAMVVALAGLLFVGAHTPFADIVAQLCLLGLGLGTAVPAMTAASLGSLPRGRSGVAAGTLNTARQAGSVLGVALLGALAAHGITGGLRTGLAIGVGLSVLAAVVSLSVSSG